MHILCEGQTEEIIARDVIEPRLSSVDLRVSWSIFMTKRLAGGPAFKGGLSRWPKLERELRRLLRDSSISVLTTMFDYYGFPSDAPGMIDRPQGSPYDRVRHVESALVGVIGDQRFLPNLVLHEIEAWVLADCDRLGQVMGDGGPAAALERIVQQEAGGRDVKLEPACCRTTSLACSHLRGISVAELTRSPAERRAACVRLLMMNRQVP